MKYRPTPFHLDMIHRNLSRERKNEYSLTIPWYNEPEDIHFQELLGVKVKLPVYPHDMLSLPQTATSMMQLYWVTLKFAYSENGGSKYILKIC